VRTIYVIVGTSETDHREEIRWLVRAFLTRQEAEKLMVNAEMEAARIVREAKATFYKTHDRQTVPFFMDTIKEVNPFDTRMTLGGSNVDDPLPHYSIEEVLLDEDEGQTG